MSPSYQTIPPANAPKDERSSTPVPMMKKVVIAAMVGTALVAGYSYGASTNPAMIKSVTNSFAKMEKEDCYNGPCNKNIIESACLSGTHTKGCNWYPHWRDGRCSSCSGVDCGGHRAVECHQCNYYGGTFPANKGKDYCNGECWWGTQNQGSIDDWWTPKCWPGL